MELSHEIQRRRQIASGLAEIVRWMSATTAQCKCPLGHEARLHIDDKPIPVLKCLHTACEDAVRDLNAELRRQFKGSHCRTVRTPADRERARHEKRLREIEARARLKLLPSLLELPPVMIEDWINASPYTIPDPVEDHWRLMLAGLFRPDDIVWAGELHESGDPCFQHCFRSVKEWLKRRSSPGPQVCAATFQEGTYSREKKAVRRKDFHVIESDLVTKTAFGNVIRWLQKHYVLRCLVDTGGKSIHAWFELPALHTDTGIKVPDCPEIGDRSEEAERRWKLVGRLQRARERKEKAIVADYHREREELFALLKGLGCDSAMFNFNATARLPGCQRLDDGGNVIGIQRMIYFNPKYIITP